ncbi:MAG: tetratricopeptide repeat protein [Solidesulfovibrio sp.]
MFSTQSHGVVGFGATKRKVKQNIQVFAEEQPDGTFLVRNLNKNFIPSGKSRSVSRDTLLTDYLPEPDIYMNKVVPMMRRVRQAADAGDTHRTEGELMSAEFEYKTALRVDEEHIRATFGLGLTYLDRGELENAKLVCRRILTLEAAFGEEHKHLFNEFGIKMRKHRMYEQALRYYFKAYRLSKTDDHLLYNIARTYYERDKLRLARKFLALARAINPEFPEADALVKAIDRKAEEAGATDFSRIRHDDD